MASGNISCTVMMNPLPAPGHPRGGSSERWKGQQRILDRICCCPRHFVYESSLHLAGIELAMSASTRRAAGTAPAASAGAAHQQHQQEQQHCTNRARILPESLHLAGIELAMSEKEQGQHQQHQQEQQHCWHQQQRSSALSLLHHGRVERQGSTDVVGTAGWDSNWKWGPNGWEWDYRSSWHEGPQDGSAQEPQVGKYVSYIPTASHLSH